MSRPNAIGGQLCYAALAALHRPSDPARIAAEVHRLHADQRLTANDIALALRMDRSQVIEILATAKQELHSA